MQKTLIRNERLQEAYYVAKHESGLTIYICEKPAFSGAYAVFGTKYGSVDNAFRRRGETDYTVVPEGIAHFLEHKLFESEDGDAFARYAKTGASANAYTSFDRTCYLFSCSENFDDSFAILLDFVQHPYFTEQTVQKEQGIIGQEISMYDDSPDWVVLFQALNCLYHNNPVRINIAGTAKTIAQINADLLYRCYNTFYNLQNMFLVVSGRVEADHVLAMCDRYLQTTEPVAVQTRPYNEPHDVVCSYKECAMPVSMPQFIWGIKLDCEGYLSLRERTEINILLSLLTGQQSALYNEMLEEGLINKEFGASLFEGRNFACILFSGESRDPQAVVARIQQALAQCKQQGIDAQEVELVLRQYYGRYMMTFNSVEGIGDALTDCACDGTGLYDEADLLQAMTVQDLQARLNTAFDPTRSALSVVNPLQ